MNREKFRINFALVLLLLLISAVSGWYNNWSGKLADKKFAAVPVVEILRLDTLDVTGNGKLVILTLSDSTTRYIRCGNFNIPRNCRKIQYLRENNSDEITKLRLKN